MCRWRACGGVVRGQAGRRSSTITGPDPRLCRHALPAFSAGRDAGLHPLARRPLLGVGVVQIVAPLAAVRVPAPVLVPVDREPTPQHTGCDERSNVHPYAVVEVRVPADRLLVQRLPAHVNIVGRLALADQLELLLQLLRGEQSALRPRYSLLVLGPLSGDPVSQIGIGQPVEGVVVEFVVVDEGREAVPPAVPDVPDERSVMEQPAVLGEEAIAQPLLERLADEADLGQELCLQLR